LVGWVSSAATSAGPYRRISALGFPTRHLVPVQMATDTALGVAMISGSPWITIRFFFLPTIFPQRLADCATRGINSSARRDPIGRSSLTPYAYARVGFGTGHRFAWPGLPSRRCVGVLITQRSCGHALPSVFASDSPTRVYDNSTLSHFRAQTTQAPRMRLFFLWE